MNLWIVAGIGAILLLLLGIILIGRKSAGDGIQMVNIDEALAGAKSGQMVLLDVRTDAERQQIAIPSSIHIPLADLPDKASQLEKYRNKTIVCYCHRGSRSMAAADQLTRLGYSTASLKGGILTWKPGKK